MVKNATTTTTAAILDNRDTGRMRQLAERERVLENLHRGSSEERVKKRAREETEGATIHWLAKREGWR